MPAPVPSPIYGSRQPQPGMQAGSVSVMPSSFGLDRTTLGPAFPAQQLYAGERTNELAYRERYFRCTQHDHKTFDWNGRLRPPVKHIAQPLIGGNMPDFYVPLDQRRPSAPYRLGRTIVRRFTGLVFGQNRFPSVKSNDPATQAFCRAVVKATNLQQRMIEARNIGGSCGTLGLSWWFDNGVPRVRVHNGKYLYVQEWADEDELVPAHVIELYQYSKQEFDPERRQMSKVWYWHRRDWTSKADIVFRPIRVGKKNPDEWLIDEQESVQHDDGFCHFVWVRNIPNESESEPHDGEPDYTELYEQLDILDILNSVHAKGTTVNLDPTLVLGLHPEELGDAVIKKGSDNALAVGPGGSAQYLTLGSDVINGGKTAIDGQRSQILETAECVIPDPDKVAAAQTSSVALRLIYAPMLNKADTLRSSYGGAILALLQQILDSIRDRAPMRHGTEDERFVHEPVLDDDGIPVFDDDGNPVLQAVEYVVELDPVVEKVELLDAQGNPTGEFETRETPQHPGMGRIELDWPDYFPKTPQDRQQEAGALVAANGGRPVLSQKTSVEIFADSFDRDPQEEFALIRDEQQADRDREQGMFPPIGGQVDRPDPGELDDGTFADQEDEDPGADDQAPQE